MAGPGRPKGLPKTGGRRRGSIDREQRKIITDEIAGDILTVYKKLGGVKWLLAYAAENPGNFITQCLSRLMPAPQKDDPDIQINQQLNIGEMTDLQVATRIAFALNKGVAELDPPVEEVAPRQILQEPSPALSPYDPARERWAQEVKLPEETRRELEIERQRQEGWGSSAEQGLDKRSLL